MGVVPPADGFLRRPARARARRTARCSIFDEVISGFRAAPGGAQAAVPASRPTSTCLGKIIGGGLPVGAYGRRADLMALVSPAGPVYQAGTLSGNPLAMTAGIWCLDRARQRSSARRLAALARGSPAGLADAARGRRRRACRSTRFGSVLTPFFTDQAVRDYRSATTANTTHYATFFRGMLARGVYPPPSQFEGWFLSRPTLRARGRDDSRSARGHAQCGGDRRWQGAATLATRESCRFPARGATRQTGASAALHPGAPVLCRADGGAHLSAGASSRDARSRTTPIRTHACGAWDGWLMPSTRRRGALFDANIFYPARHTLGYADALLLEGTVAAPLFWMGVKPVLIYNLLLFAAFALSGYAMYLLARSLTGSTAGALVAGVVYSPLRPTGSATTCISNCRWCSGYLVALLLIHRIVEHGRIRDGVWLGLVVAGSAAVHDLSGHLRDHVFRGAHAVPAGPLQHSAGAAVPRSSTAVGAALTHSRS